MRSSAACSLGERAVLGFAMAVMMIVIVIVVLVAVLGGRIAAFARLENLELVFLFGSRSR